MPKLYLDAGNADIKWYNGKEFGYFRHAIAQLTENDWNEVTGRSKLPPEGYIRVNGVPYAVGDMARRYQIKDRPRGAARYVETYYGVLLAQALVYALDRSSAHVTLYATHAPQDISYASDMIRVAKQRWETVSHRGQMVYQIRIVETCDEPLGGFNYYVLNKDGRESKNNQLAELTTLILDVGGYTVDTGAIDPGGVIDFRSLGSTRVGTIKMMADFEKELRANNHRRFQSTGDIDPRRIENALVSGTYRFGNVKIPCVKESRAAINMLVNDVVSIIEAAGGAANYDVALMTGGGAALLVDALQEAVPVIDFVLAEPDREYMRYANVWGVERLYKLLERLGVV